MADHYGKIRAI